MDTTPELAELFEELVTGSSEVVGLDQAQREVWVSGLLSSWRSDIVVDDPDAVDAAFRTHCTALADPAASVIAEVAESLIAGETTSVPQSAWRVTTEGGGEAQSIIIAFADPDGAEHCLLAEVRDGQLLDLNFAGAPSEVVPDPAEVRADMDHGLTVAELGAGAAAAQVELAWDAAVANTTGEQIAPAPGLLMNQLAARSRLYACRPVDGDTSPLALFVAPPREALSFTEGMSDSEVAEANSWALGVLGSALRKAKIPAEPPSEVVTAARGPIRGPIEHLDAAEQQALCFLEWADWLGVLIGLVRSGPGTPVEPAGMIDLINRCDEVSSTVPAEDRGYIEYAFEVAIAMWTDSGIVVDSALTEQGHAALVPAATAAWS